MADRVGHLVDNDKLAVWIYDEGGASLEDKTMFGDWLGRCRFLVGPGQRPA